ncbi:relaxase/mobilization nuclease domain-containing protein [Sedimentitalea todarodis]|uniref:Relaxase/mobilization nuclease domain-containing protein n=1 Tax=Sedimentitalea todarodis TaxID=1631240 RepID=A0ABU3VL98_9RHOB|nr:relaxase/mobilization nuclease domain-containing protein [Sedimentitalea todarodis]MDU9006883.1 relaxase/mobilization nuclease domain-containing protein [Sedimentitalea todarodis]
MSDLKRELGFQDCWSNLANGRSVGSPASGSFSTGKKSANEQGGDGPPDSSAGSSAQDRTGQASSAVPSISAADKARLARVVRGAAEVMVKVSKPARMDKHGNPIQVNRLTEGVRVSAHLEYISRNGKIELETSQGDRVAGKSATAELFADWMQSHDEDRANGLATDRTRITTSIVLSMPGNTNSSAVKDAVRALAEQEFGGQHDYVMALHTDTKHPHVHLTVRTVGHDGVKLNLRKADLQHLRDTFAAKLRQRGIEAESTPRSARGVTRRGERTPVYKIRQRGEVVTVDKAKRREVRRDVADHGGWIPDQSWDDAIVARRNRVMNTYSAAAAVLAQSSDPEDRALAKDVESFSRRLTDVTTERAELARDMASVRSASRPVCSERGPSADQDRGRGREDIDKRPEQKREPSRER